MIKTQNSISNEMGLNLNYLVYEPKDVKTNSPLVLFLHGAGERGDNLDLVEIHGYPKMAKGGSEFPFILVTPQCPTDRWWSEPELTILLIELITKSVNDYNVDENRVYVTGLSMGGYGTFSLVCARPDLIAAAIPICGSAESIDLEKAQKVPMWIFHGDKDSLVPVQHSIDAYRVLNSFPSVETKLTIYEGVGHDSWTETYENPDVLNWLLAQKRTD